MNEFVEECRREWRRLGVRDADANEMAADLAADLGEAEAEGGSPEDVLGTSAFDPRGFAAAWAVARGVTGATVPVPAPVPDPVPAPGWRPRAAVMAAALVGVVVAAVALVLAAGPGVHAFAFAVRRVAIRSGSVGITPGPGSRLAPGQLIQPLVVGHGSTGGPQVLALLVLVIAVVALGVFAAVRWSPWTLQRRDGRGNRDGGPPAAGWN